MVLEFEFQGNIAFLWAGVEDLAFAEELGMETCEVVTLASNHLFHG